MYKGPHLIAIVTMLLSACQTTVSNQTSLNATWKYAPVSIPKSMTIDGTTCTGTLASQKIRKCMEKIHPERMYPLVIYMHGCSGLGAPSLGGGNWNTIRTLRSLGYAVIAPDSYARLGRKEECKPKGRKHFTLSLRFAEIRYALAQIQKFDWVDQSRLVLAGVSEGGNTVAEYNG